MAHFAEIDDAGTVLRVLVVPDEQEARGEAFLRDDLKLGGRWVQTSYNATIRKHYAGIGSRYDKDLDAFVPPQPFVSWRLNKKTAQWEAPVPRPQAAGDWVWNEDERVWERTKR